MDLKTLRLVSNLPITELLKRRSSLSISPPIFQSIFGLKSIFLEYHSSDSDQIDVDDVA